MVIPLTLIPRLVLVEQPLVDLCVHGLEIRLPPALGPLERILARLTRRVVPVLSHSAPPLHADDRRETYRFRLAASPRTRYANPTF